MELVSVFHGVGQVMELWTVLQALRYIWSKIRSRSLWGPKRSKEEEAREVLHSLVLAHVPVGTLCVCVCVCVSVRVRVCVCECLSVWSVRVHASVCACLYKPYRFWHSRTPVLCAARCHMALVLAVMHLYNIFKRFIASVHPFFILYKNLVFIN